MHFWASASTLGRVQVAHFRGHQPNKRFDTRVARICILVLSCDTPNPKLGGRADKVVAKNNS